MKTNRKKSWTFKLIERFNYLKIKSSLESQENSEEDICSRRSTIDFNDLEDDPDPEIENQNPFLLGKELEEEMDEESENGMFLGESMNQSEGDMGPLVVMDEIPQAKIVGFEDGVNKVVASEPNKPDS